MSSPVSASITANFREELPQLRINTNLLIFYIFLCFGFMPTVSCHPKEDGIPLPGAYGRRRVRPIFQFLLLKERSQLVVRITGFNACEPQRISCAGLASMGVLRR
jgi:hypothetical protein